MKAVLAGVDFGSNKTGYFVAERRAARLVPVERGSRFTRLAERMRKTGRLTDAAMDRTLEWCGEMRDRFRELGVTRCRAVGTEALRRADNSRRFLHRVERAFGWPVEVISGATEGRLTFDGVRLGYPRGPLAILDIGGGSTELATGAGRAVDGLERVQVSSLDLGAVVLTEQHGERWDELVAAVLEKLERIEVLGPLPEVLTVLGGTGANLAMIDRGESDLVDERIEGHIVDRERLKKLRRRTAALTPSQRVAKFGLPPRRADIQVAGLAILETVVDYLGLRAVRATRYALRHGVVRSLAM